MSMPTHRRIYLRLSNINSILIVVSILCMSIFLVVPSNASVQVFAKQFTATMLGGNEVPPVNTNASGYGSFRTAANNTLLKYRVNMTGLSNVTGAQIHQGIAGQNGDTIVDLWNDSKKNTGKLATVIRGNITDTDLTGPMKGKILDAFLAVLRAGNTYVNINTSSHPEGEIRGQIK